MPTFAPGAYVRIRWTTISMSSVNCRHVIGSARSPLVTRKAADIGRSSRIFLNASKSIPLYTYTSHLHLINAADR